MKNLYLGYETARWYWEHAAHGAQTLNAQPRRSALVNCVTTPGEARAIVKGTIFEQMPLHVLCNAAP